MVDDSDKIDKLKHISKITNEDKTSRMLKLFKRNNKKNLRYMDFKKYLGVNDKIVAECLNKLCATGFIKKSDSGRGYVRTDLALNYDFKYEDIKFLRDCPLNFMVSQTITGQEDSLSFRGATFYGLEKRDPSLEDMIIPTLINIRKYIDSIHEEKLWDIINKEFKNIENKKIIEAIKNWYDSIRHNLLLFSERRRDEITSLDFMGEPPEGYEDEYYNAIEKIWREFNKKCPPIGIVFRF